MVETGIGDGETHVGLFHTLASYKSMVYVPFLILLLLAFLYVFSLLFFFVFSLLFFFFLFFLMLLFYIWPTTTRWVWSPLSYNLHQLILWDIIYCLTLSPSSLQVTLIMYFPERVTLYSFNRYLFATYIHLEILIICAFLECCFVFKWAINVTFINTYSDKQFQ